jgi:hypothetical protein
MINLPHRFSSAWKIPRFALLCLFTFLITRATAAPQQPIKISTPTSDRTFSFHPASHAFFLDAIEETD